MQQRKKIIIMSPGGKKKRSKELRLASECASFVPLKNALMFVELPLFDDFFLSSKHTHYDITHVILSAPQLRMELVLPSPLGAFL